MFKFILIALIYTAVAGKADGKPFYDIENSDFHFADFIRYFNKTYENKAEYTKRFGIFVANLKIINQLNEEHELATFDVNHFADMTSEERSAILGFVPSNVPIDPFPAELDGVEIPDAVDWRLNNGVTTVKNQGIFCGSCWAFSATAVLESQVAIKKKKMLDLSEQQLVDCDKTDNGCNGGFPTQAFQYLQGAGQALESDYQYLGFDGICQYSGKPAVKIQSSKNYGKISEEKMATLVAEYGPISISLYMSTQLSFYSGGILIPTDCDGGEVNHAVAVVGYGTEGGKDYWIIKNSWGRRYGNEGYLRIGRGKGFCQLNENVATVTIL